MHSDNRQWLGDQMARERDEIDRLRAELAAFNERYSTLQTAAIDYWNASYVRSPTGEAASEALIALFEASAVTHTWDLDGVDDGVDDGGETGD